jgi:rod shape-determining protein MreD
MLLPALIGLGSSDSYLLGACRAERVGVFHAWTVDCSRALTGRLFGQYALAYSLVIYFCLILHKRLRQFPLPQQSVFIFLCLLLTQLLLFWLKNIQTPTQFHISFWLPVVTGTLCWPLVYIALRFVRLRGLLNKTT